MKTLPFVQVDAFTETPYLGNPCVVVLDAGGLSTEQMQTIAREMNLSETAFLIRQNGNDIEARYFTPQEEIPLAGHPTISLFQVLHNQDRLKLSDGCTQYNLHLPAGEVSIALKIEKNGTLYTKMTQRSVQFLREYDPEFIAQLINLDSSQLYPDYPIQTVSTGTPQLMIPLPSIDILNKVRIDPELYLQEKENSDFFSIHCFTPPGIYQENATMARHPAVPPDYIEDPFTGSATGNMACYLYKYGLLRKNSFHAFQGHSLNRPGKAFVEVVLDGNQLHTASIEGCAVQVLCGEILVPDPRIL